MKLNIYGSLFGIDGYSNHTKNLFNALYELNPDIKLEVPLPPDWMLLVNDAELNAITKKARKADVAISISQPQFWKLSMSNCEKFVGFLVWEGDKIPKYWISYLMDDRVSQIWVPSEHTKNAIVKALEEKNKDMLCKTAIYDWVKSMIKIVPHGIDTNIMKPIKVNRSNKFTFICNKGWRGGWEDRGGVAYVLKAYCEEFKKDENVSLLLKLNPTYLNPQLLKEKLDELNLPKDRPEIKINIENMPYKKLPELYCQADVYVCAQRADAFNLCGLEAMGCGLPTIQTNYGGQTDYMTEKNSLFISHVLEEVKGDIIYEGIKWAIPTIDHLKAHMRKVYQSYSNQDNSKFVEGAINSISEMSKQALKDAQYWTWNNSAKKAIEFLKEL